MCIFERSYLSDIRVVCIVPVVNVVYKFSQQKMTAAHLYKLCIVLHELLVHQWHHWLMTLTIIIPILI